MKKGEDTFSDGLCVCFLPSEMSVFFHLLENITRKHFNDTKNLLATGPIFLLCTEVEQEVENYCQKNPQTVPLDGDLNCCMVLCVGSPHWDEFPLLGMTEPNDMWSTDKLYCLCKASI